MKAKEIIKTKELEAKLFALSALIHDHTKARMVREWTPIMGTLSDAQQACIDQSSRVVVTIGKAYARVDVGDSGRYMVDADGNIFGIKAYGVIHRGHQYGTLDTINNFFWGFYRAEAL
jgi:hypothetical protein